MATDDTSFHPMAVTREVGDLNHFLRLHHPEGFLARLKRTAIKKESPLEQARLIQATRSLRHTIRTRHYWTITMSQRVSRTCQSGPLPGPMAHLLASNQDKMVLYDSKIGPTF